MNEKMKDLKVQAYDILAQMQLHQVELQKLQVQLNGVNEQIAKLHQEISPTVIQEQAEALRKV